MKTETCPSPQALQHLLLGTLPRADREPLEEHLLSCDRCVANAETLATDDDLTQLTREASVTPDNQPEAVLALIDRIKAARKQAETIRIEETLAGLPPTATSRSPVDGTPLDLSFLAPAQSSDELGRLGEYRVLQVLGMGGMGVVLKAEDVRLKRVVALKTMKPSIASSRDAKSRFLREAQATAALEHDHIVPIYQVGEDRGVPFIAMQFLKGESLAKRLDRVEKLSTSEVVRLGKEVALGLSCAHDAGMIHRDIKPDNIWLDEKMDRAKILDFGLVSATSEDEGLTHAGTVLGTPKYMAPEQALAYPVDHRGDLFSLGSVLYHAAAAKAPFAADNFTSTLIAVAHQPPTPLQAAAPDLHPDVSKLIMQLLEKDPANRPQTANEVAHQFAGLEQALRHGRTKDTAADPMSEALADRVTPVAQPAVPPDKPPKRKRLLAAAGGFAAILLGILVITIREKDGKETVIRVPSGTEIDVDAQPGSKVTIREQGMAAMSGSTVTNRPKSGQRSSGVNQSQVVPDAILADWIREKHGAVSPQAEGAPLSALSLVTHPAKLEGISSWTLETPTHRGTINVCQMSPDGKVLATGGEDGTIRVWSVEDKNLITVLCGHNKAVRSIDWSADGSAILSAASGEFCIWDWKRSQQLIHQTIPMAESQSWAKWLPADKELLTLTRNGDMVIWDLETLSPFKSIAMKQSAGSDRSSLSFDRDDKFVVTVNPPNSVAVWNTLTSESVQTISVADPWLAALSPDGTTIATADRKGQVMVFDVATGNTLSEPLLQPGPWSCALEFSPDGNFLALARGYESSVYLWNTSTWKQAATVRTPHASVSSFCWSDAGHLLVTTGTGSGTPIAFWDSHTQRPKGSIRGPINHEIQHVACHPEVLQLVVSTSVEPLSGLSKARIVTLEDDAKEVKLPGLPAHFAGDLRWSRTGRFLHDRELNLWDLEQAVSIPKEKLSPPSYFAYNLPVLAWSADDEYLARPIESTADGKNVRTVCITQLLDLKSSPVSVKEDVFGVDFSLVSNEMAVHHGPDANSASISVIETSTGKLQRTRDTKGLAAEAADGLRWSPDGKHIAASYVWGIYVFDATTLEALDFLEYDQGGAGARDFRWVGNTAIASVVAAGSIHIWSAPWGHSPRKPDHRIAGLLSSPAEMSVSPDQRLLFARDHKTGSVLVCNWQTQQGNLRLIGLDSDEPRHAYAITANGDFKPLSDSTSQSELIAVVQNAQGQRWLPLEEFSHEYGWQNHPENVSIQRSRVSQSGQ